MSNTLPPLGSPADWLDIELVFGAHMVDAIRTGVGADPNQDRGVSIRCLLTWIAEDSKLNPHGTSSKVVQQLANATNWFENANEFGTALRNSAKRWKEALKAAARHSVGTQANRVRTASAVLLEAAQQPHSPILRWERKWLQGQSPKGCGTRYSLADGAWPQLEGLSGAARERMALQISRASFMEYFMEGRRLFQFGQALLQDQPDIDGTNIKARGTLRVALVQIRSELAAHGHVRLLHNKKASGIQNKKYKEAWYNSLRDANLWRSAGLDLGEFGVDNIYKDVAKIKRALLGGIGPGRWTSYATLGILCCDTGWNLQPLSSLPKYPFVFRTVDRGHIGTSAYIRAFKNRAGHDVLAYLESSPIISGSRFNTAIELWKATASEIDPESQRDGYAILGASEEDTATTGLDVLDTYISMRNSLCDLHPNLRRIEPMWVSLSTAGTVSILQNEGNRKLPDVFKGHPVLDRKPMGWSAIRKTVLALRLEDSGTMSGVRSPAGHKGTGVLMPHYLNTPAIIAKLDRSIRDYQDRLEAVAIRNLDQGRIALALRTTEQDLERLRSMATSAGISVTFGVGVQDDSYAEAPPQVEFAPTDGNLKELFLVHRKLSRMQATYLNRARWELHWLPVFALVKAIGREVFRGGLGRRYRQAARIACADLRSGVIVLPCLDD